MKLKVQFLRDTSHVSRARSHTGLTAVVLLVPAQTRDMSSAAECSLGRCRQESPWGGGGGGLCRVLGVEPSTVQEPGPTQGSSWARRGHGEYHSVPTPVARKWRHGPNLTSGKAATVSDPAQVDSTYPPSLISFSCISQPHHPLPPPPPPTWS